MTWINTITDSPNQSMTLKLDTGELVTFSVSYMQSQQGWFFSLSGGGITVNNRRLVAGVNMLRAFRNLISFGLACITSDGYEPVFIEDFANERAKLFLLNSTDITTAEAMLNG